MAPTNGNTTKEGTSPLSSSAPAGSDVDMADSSKGSTRKPRAASQKRPVTRDDASTDSEEEDASPKPVKKKASDKVDKAGMLYCHQDHTGHDATKEVLLRCTGSKPVSTKPGAAHKACILMYCERCLQKHYEEDARAIIKDGDQDSWKCPSCRNMCSCSVCRRKSALAAGLAPPPKRAAPGQGKSTQASRAQDAKRRRARGYGSDSSLSSVESEPRKGGLPNRKAPRVQQPATIPNAKRASPPPRPPKSVDPPKTFPLAGVHPTPATTSILARLHLRAFVLRFLPLMPSLQGSGMKVTQVLQNLSDDLIWMWSRRDAELAQRIILKALLELIEKEREEEIFAERQSRRLMVQLVDKEMKRAMSSSNRDEVMKPWSTLKEIAILEEVWAGGWGDKAVEWELEREELEGPESETRGRKGEMGPDEKLALLCSLIELTYNAEGVRQSLVDGIESEKTTMVALNKKKFKQRHDWIERKQVIIAKKPPKPTAPSKGTTLAKLAEVWRSEVQDIDAEVVEAEKDSQKETFEIQRYIYLAQTSNRVRFASAGEDARGNTYYLLSPCNHSGFPASSTLGMTDDYPLSWTILVHGTPYALSPVTSAHDDPDNKSNGVNGEAKAKTMTKTSAAAAAAAAAPVSVEERELARAKRGDAWFLVDPLKEGDLLIEWIEFGAKFVMYDRKKAAYDRAKEGKPELTGVEAEPSKKEDQSDLIHAIRVYVEYVKAAKELAKAEVKEKGKGRVAAQKVKDGAGYGEGDEDDEEDQDDMLDEDAMHDEEEEDDEEDELDSD